MDVGGAVSNATSYQVTVLRSGPEAVADAYQASQNRVLTVPTSTGVLANDHAAHGGKLKAHLVHGPAHGTLTLNANGSFRYVPRPFFYGMDVFQYVAQEGKQH